MHEPAPIPDVSPRAFLVVRRGVPVLVAFVSFLAAAKFTSGRMFFVILALACLAEVWPTFQRRQKYLQNRSSLVRQDGRWVRALRPLARLLGKDEEWVLSFCAWNNQRVWDAFQHRPARKALVLLPHCIQMAACKAEILQDLNHCHTCGLCSVGDVLENELSQRWEIRISNRSHKAYREAREFRPDLILAVSCTDRLLKGLIKLPEVPSYAIPLTLPHGMCVDTAFSVPTLFTAMDALVETKAETRFQPLKMEA